MCFLTCNIAFFGDPHMMHIYKSLFGLCEAASLEELKREVERREEDAAEAKAEEEARGWAPMLHSGKRLHSYGKSPPLVGK